MAQEQTPPSGPDLTKGVGLGDFKDDKLLGHVGDDEVLLDDSLRYAERAQAAGVDAEVDVWMGMPHGFPASVGKLKAAAQALDAIGAFLTERLHGQAGQ